MITIKVLKKIFSFHQKLIKKNQNQNLKKSIAERVKLKNETIAEIKKEKKTYKLFNEYFINYQSPRDMYKKLLSTEDARNEDQVYSIKEVLNRM